MSIRLDQVSFSYLDETYRELNVLDHVTLNVEKGEAVGIMGRTGCGKTTLLHLAAGLAQPSAGKVFLNGCDINQKGYDRNLLRRQVGIVFQCPEYQLFESTVEKDVAFGLKYSGFTGKEVSERVRWALETMELDYDRIRTQSPLGLSGGEKRRVAIAGVLVSRPEILLFDEPTTGLDPASRDVFLRIVTRLNQEGTTILMVSHNGDVLGEFAQRLLVMDKGQVVKDGSTREIFAGTSQMKALGLGVSRPREIADLLSQKGICVPSDMITYSELLSFLKGNISETRAGEKN